MHRKTFVLKRRHEDHGVRTFLPACLLAKAGPAITRLARQGKYTIPSDSSVGGTARRLRRISMDLPPSPALNSAHKTPQAEQAAKKMTYAVILSEAKNLSSM
jgi:hypothetical protein